MFGPESLFVAAIAAAPVDPRFTGYRRWAEMIRRAIHHHYSLLGQNVWKISAGSLPVSLPLEWPLRRFMQEISLKRVHASVWRCQWSLRRDGNWNRKQSPPRPHGSQSEQLCWAESCGNIGRDWRARQSTGDLPRTGCRASGSANPFWTTGRSRLRRTLLECRG